MTRHETIIKWARFFSHDLVSCSARAYILFLQTQFQNEAFAQGARGGKDSNPTDYYSCLYGLPLLSNSLY